MLMMLMIFQSKRRSKRDAVDDSARHATDYDQSNLTARPLGATSYLLHASIYAAQSSMFVLPSPRRFLPLAPPGVWSQRFAANPNPVLDICPSHEKFKLL
jgi:hypothetical protein